MKQSSDIGIWLGGLGEKFRRVRPSKRVVQVLLLLLIVFLAFNVYREREMLLSFKWLISWKHIVAAVVVHWIALVLMQANWHWMVSFIGGSKNWRKNFYIYGLSLAARRLPAPLTDLGARFYLYPAEETPPRIIAVAASLELSLLGLNGVLCYIIFLPFYSTIPSVFPWWIFVLTGFVGTVVLITFPNLLVALANHLLHWMRRAAVDIKIERKTIVAWLIVYQLVWIVDGFALYFTVVGLIGGVLNWGDSMRIATLSTLVGFISQFLPAGFGIKEVISGTLLSQWIPFGVGIVLAVGFRVLMTVVEIVWAWICHKLWGNQLNI